MLPPVGDASDPNGIFSVHETWARSVLLIRKPFGGIDMKFRNVLLVASCVLGGACGELPSDVEGSEHAATLADYVEGTVKDELPAGIICSGGYSLIGIKCVGGYCDDMVVYCSSNTGYTDGHYGLIPSVSDGWSQWISEEVSPKTPYQHNGHTVIGNTVACESSFGVPFPNRKVIDGLRASGSHSDDISVHCATLQGGHTLNVSSCSGQVNSPRNGAAILRMRRGHVSSTNTPSP